jgi:glc operon protein GlcG
MGIPGRVAVQGGVPIMYEAECVGAVGVSGVKSCKDEQIAKAGLLLMV